MDKLNQLEGLEERLIVDTSEGHPVYLLAVGKHPTYIRLSATSYYLLEQRNLGVSFESLSQTLSQKNQYVSSEEVENSYNKIIHKISQIESNTQSKSSEFFFRFTLIPKFLVEPIARTLSICFSRKVVYFLLGTIGLAIAIAPRHDLNLEMSTDSFFWGYLLFLFSLLIHEFGHASACQRYGAKPSDIGFTFYLIWPAFYSDVSDAWRLKRWQRVIVDIGGVYFQLIIASCYIFIYTASNFSPLKLAIIMIAGSCLFTLNPVFKFDGYWVISDVLGVTNLSQQPLRIIRHYWDKFRGRAVRSLPWPPRIMGILTFYTILSFVIWGYFIWIIFPLFWQEVLNYPSLVTNIFSDFLISNSALDLAKIQSFIGSTFLISIGGLMLFQLIQLLFKFTQKILVKKHDG